MRHKATDEVVTSHEAAMMAHAAGALVLVRQARAREVEGEEGGQRQPLELVAGGSSTIGG